MNSLTNGWCQKLPIFIGNREAVFDNEHTKHREMLVEFDNYRGTGNPVKLSRTPAQINRKPPKFGEHNDEILGKPALAEQTD